MTEISFKTFPHGLWSSIRWVRLRLVRVKVFPENRYFSEMLFSRKENVFMCLVAFQKLFWKIFSDVWLCSWKYHRKHIFYLLLTFSHIFSTTKQIYNIIPQYRNKKEIKPRKKKFIKSGQIERRRKRERRLGLI